ncbi:hypothetical protein [Reinekea sp.]|uniref:hypothetical protein n=1 Tax=Reinekea sp. TaxID=1970455 RepID=UPI002A7FD8CF|nr:hypothetical protein [Reinekea sp.]
MICLTRLLRTTRQCVYRALIFVCATGFGSLYAADFGVAQWGMTLSEVKALESRTNLTPFGQQDYLIFKVALTGVEQTRIVYQFSKQTLVSGRFLFSTQDPFNIPQALIQYQQISSQMSSQYGTPYRDQVLTNPVSAQAPAAADYATELASDRIILKSAWRSASSTIQHQLAWQSNRPNHQLVYRPIKAINVPELKNAF